MSIPIIKLLYDGELEEINITCKKKENYNLNNFLKKVNLDDNLYYSEVYSWELEQKKKLVLIGSTFSTHEGLENIHQLPLKNEYQFYDNLYAVIIHEHKYCPLNMENFENIYNALYLKIEDETDEIDSIYSSEDDDLDEKNLIDQDDDENIIEDYGEGDEDCDDNIEVIGKEGDCEEGDCEGGDGEGNNGEGDGCILGDGDETGTDEDLELEMEKKKKSIKRKKIIKLPEIVTKDILKTENELKELKDETRIKCLQILNSVFSKITKADTEYMRNVERSIFNYSFQKSIERNIIPTWNIVFKNIYLNKVISLYSNLSKNNYIKNNRLLLRLKNREFTPEQLVQMTPQELFPENWKELIDEKYRRDKILYETKKEAMTDQFKCSKCHSRETCYFEMQTRSADEPMTIFITCLNCGKRWKN